MDKKQSTSTLTSILAGGLAGASETVVTVGSLSSSLLINSPLTIFTIVPSRIRENTSPTRDLPSRTKNTIFPFHPTLDNHKSRHQQCIRRLPNPSNFQRHQIRCPLLFLRNLKTLPHTSDLEHKHHSHQRSLRSLCRSNRKCIGCYARRKSED